MARLVVESEDAKMNMTPMIDMTFLLVVFFMLTIDLTQKEFVPVELPYATQGAENKDRETEKNPRFVINLQSNGVISFKGNEFNLASDNRAEQHAAIKQLKAKIMELVLSRGSEAYEPDGACKIPVLIHADRRAPWKYVQWIMQAGADPQIKIYRLQFSVKRPIELMDAPEIVRPSGPDAAPDSGAPDSTGGN